MVVFTLKYVNKNSPEFLFSSKIPELDGYDTIFCHGTENSVIIYMNNGDEIEYTAREFSEIIRNSSSYTGKAIRLVACNTGSSPNGFAQNLADVMNVEVMAPSEAIWIDSYGNSFISNNDVLAEMWFSGENVKETGEWRIFIPKKGGVVV